MNPYTIFLPISLLFLAGGAITPQDSLSANTRPGTGAFHSATPAGYEAMVLKPGGLVLTLVGLIECPELEGAQQIAAGVRATMVDAAGEPLTNFPRTFSFRVTASLRKMMLTMPSRTVRISEEPEELLLKLRFVLKTYRGLESRQVAPVSVQLIGLPQDVPYDERVYRVTFDVGDLLVTDRCVLMVLSPDGERLTRFHFNLL